MKRIIPLTLALSLSLGATFAAEQSRRVVYTNESLERLPMPDNSRLPEAEEGDDGVRVAAPAPAPIPDSLPESAKEAIERLRAEQSRQILADAIANVERRIRDTRTRIAKLAGSTRQPGTVASGDGELEAEDTIVLRIGEVDTRQNQAIRRAQEDLVRLRDELSRLLATPAR